MTYEAVFSEKLEKKQKKSDGYVQESQKIPKLMAMMEKHVRIFDQLDEQLHAGFYFYLMIGVKKFISNNEYMYPAALLFAGFLIPNFFDYYEASEKLEKEEKDKESKDSDGQAQPRRKMDQTVRFIGLLYFMCMMFAILPFALFLFL